MRSQIINRLSCLFGLLFSVLAIWGMGFLFADSAEPLQLYPGFSTYVHAPGVVRHRSEGWGNTRYGAYGLFEEELESAKVAEKVVFYWGDSHVEALQVSNPSKAGAVYNRLKPAEAPSLISIGGSGFNIVDYLQLMPTYEALFPQAREHVILLSGLQDVLPTQTSENGSSLFLTSPFAFEPLRHEPSRLSKLFSPQLNQLGLATLVAVYRSIKNHEFRFSPGPVHSPSGEEGTSGSLSFSPRMAWGFVFDQIRATTNLPVSFLYIPYVPRLNSGQIDFEDKTQSDKSSFMEMCSSRGFGFYDLSLQFQQLYEEMNLFPRGFRNTSPSHGHLNEHGHRLIGEELVRIVSEGAR